MIYRLDNEYEVPRFREKVEAAIASGATIEFKKIHPVRTLRQNSYLHVLLGYFGSEYGLSLDEVKLDIFKRHCNKDIFLRTDINKKGKTIQHLRSTSTLTTAEMTTAIERFRNWSASVAGIYLPSPDEQEFLIHCRQVIEQHKDYL